MASAVITTTNTITREKFQKKRSKTFNLHPYRQILMDIRRNDNLIGRKR